MRRKIILGSLLLATISLTTSCDGFLSEVPDNRTQIDNPKKAAELITTAYPDGTMGVFGETMSDNAYDSEFVSATDVTNTEMYNWENVRSESQDSPTHFWEACYKAIAAANTGIEAIDGFIAEYEKTNKSTTELYSIRGEALIARAYAHFMLVNIWGKTYDVNDQSSLGVPYVTKPETSLLPEYERNTVYDVYELIENDLIEGLAGLDDSHLSEETMKYHFNVEAARAFATQFFLFKGDFEKAVQYSSSVSSPASHLRDMVYYSSLDPDTHPVQYTKPSEKANLMVTTVVSNMRRTLGLNRFSFVNEIADEQLFSSNTNPLNGQWLYLVNSYSNTKGLFLGRHNEYFKITDATNMTGYPYVNLVLFSNDLLFLNRLEALVMENRMEEALDGLSYFILSRTSNAQKTKLSLADVKDFVGNSAEELDPFYTMTSDQKAVVKLIADMRRRESYTDGQRFFEIKRYNLEITHTSLELGDNVLEKNDLRKQVQLPIMAISKGLEANPR